MDTGTLRKADEAADQATGRLFPLIGVGSGGARAVLTTEKFSSES